MDRQAIECRRRIAFSNANCALPKTGQKRRWRKVRFNGTFRTQHDVRVESVIGSKAA
jgi:hypothetical protein